MKALWEIFRLELRGLVRSKAFLFLVSAALAWMLVLPRVLKGDGTESGTFELHIRYSFGVVFVLVLAALASSAAGSIARDRAAKRLQLTLVRPVRHGLVALGRMFALTAAGASVLAMAALILFFQLGRGRVCDHALQPCLEPPQAVAARLFDEYLRTYPDFKEKVVEQGERAIRRYLLDYVKETYQTVAPGETASWEFPTNGLSATVPMAVRIRVTDMFGRLAHVAGTFRLGERRGEFGHVNKTLIRVPLSEGAVGERLSFTNTGTMPVTIYPRRDISLLYAADSFGANLARATVELTAVLALILALALCFSACLGRSVAVFSIVSLLIVMVVSPSVVEQYPDPTTATRLDRLSLALTELSADLTAPLNAYSPIEALESEICLERPEVLRAVLWNVILLPLLLSALAGLVMVRKQE